MDISKNIRYRLFHRAIHSPKKPTEPETGHDVLKEIVGKRKPITPPVTPPIAATPPVPGVATAPNTPMAPTVKENQSKTKKEKIVAEPTNNPISVSPDSLSSFFGKKIEIINNPDVWKVIASDPQKMKVVQEFMERGHRASSNAKLIESETGGLPTIEHTLSGPDPTGYTMPLTASFHLGPGGISMTDQDMGALQALKNHGHHSFIGSYVNTNRWLNDFARILLHLSGQ